jgi:hypothetical protein
MSRRQQLEATEWAKEFKADAPPGTYEAALVIASLDVVKVDIYKSNESGAMLWHVQYEGGEFPYWKSLFWLDSKKTDDEARELCDAMGWVYT